MLSAKSWRGWRNQLWMGLICGTILKLRWIERYFLRGTRSERVVEVKSRGYSKARRQLIASERSKRREIKSKATTDILMKDLYSRSNDVNPNVKFLEIQDAYVEASKLRLKVAG